MRSLLVFFVVASLRLAAAEVKLNGFTFSLPDGFTIELAAGTPLVERPISAAFDEQGRLYVTCVSGTGDPVEKQLIDRPHQVIRLEDTDGDGRYDRRTVFADRLSFPEGAMWHGGSLYVGAPPQIWKFTDADGDGVAERRSVWFDGQTIGHCANDIHGPMLGRDGWFYWTKGAFNEQQYTLPNGRSFTTRASHIFRARPDGAGLEPVLTGGMDNPVDLTFTASGERILASTFFITPGGGQRDGLTHAIYGGLYGKEHAVLDGHIATGGLMPNLLHVGAAAPSAVTCFDATNWGSDYRNSIFAAYFNLRKVSWHPLLPWGSTFKTQDRDFVVADSADFHPTDVLVDADGSLLIIDTGGWYKLCCPTSQLAKPDVLGAIYRVRKASATPLDDPRGLHLDWEKATALELAVRLGDPRFAVRERAILALAARGPGAVPALRTAPNIEARVQAVWVATRIPGPEARAFVRSALDDPYHVVRDAARNSIALWRDREAVPQLLKLIHYQTAAEALGRIGDPSAVPALLAAAAQIPASAISSSGAPADDAVRIREHALIYALIEIGDAAATARGLEATDSAVRRAALVALDQMRPSPLTPEQVTPLLTSEDTRLQRTAIWIVSHRPEWGASLATYFRQRLAQSELPEDDLPGMLARLAKSPAIQELLAATLHDSSTNAARRTALVAMAAAGLKDTPPTWLESLTALLSGSDPSLLGQAIATASRLPLPKTGHPALTSALAAVGRRSDLPISLRLDALATSGAPGALDTPLFDLLLAQLPPTRPLSTRTAAADTLARALLTAEQLLALTHALKSTGPLETSKLLAAFGRSQSEALGLRLVAALENSPGRRGVRPARLQSLLAKYPSSVQTAGEALLTQIDADQTQLTARVSTLLASLPAGDVRRGQIVFNSAKAACTACHAIGYAGGRLGPDLTRIGQARTTRDLLEAIVAPSASFVQGYEPFTVTTRDGVQHFGLLRQNSPEEVLLATGPQSEERLARADVTEMQPGNISLMPQGFDQLLNAQELADLIAFLNPKK
jgi:putative membrane-bound dehydrogenase-like protein